MRLSLAAALCAFALAISSNAQTYITNVSPDIQTESPTLRVHGSGFGGNPRVFMGLGGGAVPLIPL